MEKRRSSWQKDIKHNAIFNNHIEHSQLLLTVPYCSRPKCRTSCEERLLRRFVGDSMLEHNTEQREKTECTPQRRNKYYNQAHMTACIACIVCGVLGVRAVARAVARAFTAKIYRLAS